MSKKKESNKHFVRFSGDVGREDSNMRRKHLGQSLTFTGA